MLKITTTESEVDCKIHDETSSTTIFKIVLSLSSVVIVLHVKHQRSTTISIYHLYLICVHLHGFKEGY